MKQCLAAFMIAAVLVLYDTGTVDTPVEQPETSVIVQPIPEPEPVVVVEEEAFDPVREDIPLDAETQRLLWQACEETGIQYELALAVIWQETDFRNIKGDGGASAGYMQIQRRWHEDRMERLGVTDLTDSYSNFLVGCDYLAELIEKDRGLEWALHAYNGGPSYANKMAKAGKISQYAKDVLNYLNILKNEGDF
jgi:soluble lytic murein transglycosylase-like protein